MNFTPNGQWGWNDRTVQSNNGAAFRNPGGGFACSGGNDWVVKTTCVTGSSPDQAFLLIGRIGAQCGTPTATSTATPTNTPSATSTPTATATATPTGSPACTPGYSFTTSAGTITPGTTDTGNHVDDGTTPITLPFLVSLYGTPYTNAIVDSNGVLAFTAANSTFSNTCLPGASYTDAIFAHWDDLRTDDNSGCASFPGGVCGIFTAVTGSAPNRVMVVEWRAVYFGSTGTTANFEVLLHEGSSNFEVVYGTLADGGNGATAGVQKGIGAVQTTEFSCNDGLPNNTQVSFTLGGCGTPTATPTLRPQLRQRLRRRRRQLR